MEGWQFQPLQSLLVRQMSQLRNKTRCPPLDPLHQPCVSYVEWAPDLVTVLKMWANQGLEEQGKRLGVKVGEAVSDQAKYPVGPAHGGRRLLPEF